MEGNRTSSGSGTIKQTWPKDEFTDLVLSWSLQDIYDEDLYQHQVEKIPESFESVDSYLGSYIFPLLEETRAELASATETVYNAPFAEVTSFSEQRHGKFLYSFKVDDWRNRLSDGGREPYKTLPGDLVLISDVEPKTISDLLRVGFTYTLASVINIEDDGSDNNCTSSSFALKSSREIDFGDGQGESLYVVYLVNITPLKRIWNALRMRRNLTIVDKLLAKNNLNEEICDVCCHKANAEMEEKLGSTLFSKLNESQLDAILSCLSKSECDHKPSVELIWGPPGTGKTATLSRLLFSLLKKKVRTLICAPTNVAIKELASRVITLVRNESEENNLSCPLGDMLIFGNKDRLKVSSDIEEIFLEYRVDRLVSCLGSLTGWKHCISSMLDFLQDCVSHHQIFVENELIAAKQSLEHVESKSLLEFVRDRFPRLATPLRDCMTTFFTHLPRNRATDMSKHKATNVPSRFR